MSAFGCQVAQAQPEATSAPARGPSGPRGPDPTASCAANAGVVAVMFLLLYVLIVRPQRKQEREHQQMLASLRKGDVVRTRGGIRGEITAIGEREVTLLVADRVKIHVLKSAIVGVEQRAGEATIGASAGAGKDGNDKKKASGS